MGQNWIINLIPDEFGDQSHIIKDQSIVIIIATVFIRYVSRHNTQNIIPSTSKYDAAVMDGVAKLAGLVRYAQVMRQVARDTFVPLLTAQNVDHFFTALGVN